MYDEEIDFYYLRSRYYNANRCRFINADIVFDGVNLYRYCRNNPINLFDQKRTEVISIILFSAVLVGVLYYESCIDQMKGINQVEKNTLPIIQ